MTRMIILRESITRASIPHLFQQSIGLYKKIYILFRCLFVEFNSYLEIYAIFIEAISRSWRNQSVRLWMFIPFKEIFLLNSLLSISLLRVYCSLINTRNKIGRLHRSFWFWLIKINYFYSFPTKPVNSEPTAKKLEKYYSTLTYKQLRKLADLYKLDLRLFDYSLEDVLGFSLAWLNFHRGFLWIIRFKLWIEMR